MGGRGSWQGLPPYRLRVPGLTNPGPLTQPAPPAGPCLVTAGQALERGPAGSWRGPERRTESTSAAHNNSGNDNYLWRAYCAQDAVPQCLSAVSSRPWGGRCQRRKGNEAEQR